MALTNTNCLQGLCCPECGSEGPFRIAVTTTVVVDDDGFYPEPQDIRAMEWEDTSYCKCMACDYQQTVEAFIDGAALWAETVICRFCEQETPAQTAHQHQGQWVGDTCCWTEQLRASE